MINKVILCGRTTTDIELRQSGEGNNYAYFTLAVNRYNSVTQQEETDFISCITYGKLAENISKYVKKGQRLLVEGSIRVSSVNRPDGTRITTTKVEVKNADFLEKAPNPSN